jgi:hypothetical protein
MLTRNLIFSVLFLFFQLSLCQALRIDGGSMQGYFTNDQVNEILDEFTKKHRSATVETIGQTFYNRSIQLLRIRNDNKPKVLIVGGHHSRELISITQVLFLAQYLLDFPVVDTDVWLIPVINVDGLAAISEWFLRTGIILEIRKNVRPSSCLLRESGVDLNRNYGFMWGFDDFGSNPRPCDPQFRGDKAFSELETQAMRNLIERENFTLVISYHSYGDLYIRPLGYQKNSLKDFPQAHQILYKELQETLPKNLKFGSVQDLLKYSANGSLMDYLYSKGIFNIEVEISPGDLRTFHPDQGKIIKVLESHFEPFKLLFSFASSRVKLEVKCFGMFFEVKVLNKGFTRSDLIQLAVRSENSIKDVKVLSGNSGEVRGSELIFNISALDSMKFESFEFYIISDVETVLIDVEVSQKGTIHDRYKGKLSGLRELDLKLWIIITLMIISTVIFFFI